MLLCLAPVILVAMFFSSCRKEVNYDVIGDLGFTNDTLLFDTVFTTVGSVTKSFKVYNPGNGTMRIDRAVLAGGNSSPFRINIDGISGTTFYNLEIEKGDSMFVFVEVTLNVNGGTYPLVIEDSVVFETNGNLQSVKLVVWGQDAYFHVNELVSGTWPVDKPHVVYGLAAVGYPGLDSNQTLTIPSGGRIHFHKDASLVVYKSTLNVLGSEGNEVTFRGDRLDPYYRDLPGSWSGIYLLMSNNSTIEHAIIENAVTGVRCDTVFAQGTPALTMRKTEIRNHTFADFVGLGSHVIMENTLLADAGSYCAYLGWGGTYQLNHCTLANYFSASTRSTPSLVLNNYYETSGGDVIRNLENTSIRNTIVYGNLDEEFAVDTSQFGIKDFFISHFNVKVNDETFTNTSFYSNIFRNNLPGFMDPFEGDFKLSSTSFARGKADPLSALPDDLNNFARDASPDLGCYEF